MVKKIKDEYKSLDCFHAFQIYEANLYNSLDIVGRVVVFCLFACVLFG